MKRFIINLTCVTLSIFLISLILNISIYGFVDPVLRSGHEGFITKYQYLKTTDKDFDTLFFGSSRVYRQIDPVLYDSLTGAKSFNCGTSDCFPSRCTRLLEKLLEIPKVHKLKRIILEFQTLILDDHNGDTEEVYYNMNPLVDLEHLLYYSDDVDYNASHIVGVIQAMARKYTRGIRLLFYKEKQNEKYQNQWLDENKGYLPLIETVGTTEQEREKFYKEKQEKFSKLYIRSHELEKDFLAKGNPNAIIYQAYFAEVLRKFSEAGIEVILVVSPLSSDVNRIYKVHAEFLKDNKLKILNFNSGKEHPEIYKLENYFDLAHLNKEGAEIYTRVLAEKIMELEKS